MNYPKLLSIVVICSILLYSAVSYSEFGAPAEFGNLTNTTCWIGGDLGELRCMGDWLVDGDLADDNATLTLDSEINMDSCIYLTEGDAFGTVICNDGSGTNEFIIYNYRTGEYYFTIARDTGVIDFYNHTVFHETVTLDIINVTGTMTAVEINVSYIRSSFGFGSMDIRASPWWLGGADFQIEQDLIVDGDADISGNLTGSVSISASNVDRDIPANCSDGYAVIGWENLSTTYCAEFEAPGDYLINGTDANFGKLNATRNSVINETLYVVDGKVGIGTITPSQKLSVNGHMNAEGSIVANYGDLYRVAMNPGVAGDGFFIIRDSSASSNVYLRANGVSYFKGGNVGIGTITPSHALNIIQDINAMGGINISNPNIGVGAAAVLYLASDNAVSRIYQTGGLNLRGETVDADINFHVNDGGVNTVAMMIDGATGNVGVGTSAPLTSFVVGDGTASEILTISSDDSTSLDLYTSDETQHIYIQNIDGRFRVYIDGEALTILNTGKVGIGTSNPSSELQVIGEVNISGISGDGTGRVVCIKAGGNLGTCSSQPDAGGECTCG